MNTASSVVAAIAAAGLFATSQQVSIISGEQNAIAISGVVPPKTTYEVRPAYPKQGRSKRMVTIFVPLTIGKDGVIKKAVINQGQSVYSESADPAFAVGSLDEIVLKALAQWKFEPGRFNDQPVETRFTKKFKFSPDQDTPEIIDDQARMDLAELNAVPKLVKRVEPSLPPSVTVAKQERLIVEMVLNRDGTVKDVNVLRRVGESIELLAINALRQWVYEPVKVNGLAPEAVFTTTMVFSRGG